MLPLTYNLAADTWTGWEDANDTAEDYRLVGLEAARLGLKLRQEIGQGLRRGHWILGVHLIAEGQYEDAVSSFEKGRDLARKAREEQGELVAQGWIHVTNVLAGMDESAELEAVKRRARLILGRLGSS